MKPNRVEHWDRRISYAAGFYFIASVANATLKTILPIPDVYWSRLSAFWGVLIILSFVSCIKEVYRRNARLLIMSYAVFITVYLISIIQSLARSEPTQLILTGSALLTLAWWIPVGVYCSTVKNYSILYDALLKCSYVISALALSMFFFNPAESSEIEYNMSFGYFIITPLIFHIHEWQKNHRLWLLFLFIIEFLVILIYANRGVLLSIIFFLIYKPFFSGNTKYWFIKISSVCVIMFMLTVYMNDIILWLLNLFEQFGYQSRSLSMIVSGTIEATSGRDEIWQDSYDMILQRPIFGWGLGGEFVHLAQIEGAFTPNSSYHPHNGLLQNMVNFGLIIGIIVNILILKPLIGITRIKNIYCKELIMVYGSAMVIPCCVSASGFFILPAVALYLYLYYFPYKDKIIKIKNV